MDEVQMDKAKLQGPICLAAGGTGGHVFPAATVARELEARGQAIAVLTDPRGRAFTQAFPPSSIHTIAASGLVNKSLRGKAAAAWNLLHGLVQARRVLAKLRPPLVIGFGGYPCLPPLIAAWTLGIPTLLHEQNAVMGLANRLASRFANLIALSFANTVNQSRPNKARLVGNPVRKEFSQARAYQAPDHGPINLLVFGGSQGAQILTDLIPRALCLLPETLRTRLHLTLQVRKDDLEAVQQTLATAGLGQFTLLPFLDPMPRYLDAAHLVIARSGATTVSEVAAAGRPALLIPLVLQADDHQRHNARVLEQLGAALVFGQAGLSAEHLAHEIAALMTDPHRLTAMAMAAKSASRPQATQELVDLAFTLIEDMG